MRPLTIAISLSTLLAACTADPAAPNSSVELNCDPYENTGQVLEQASASLIVFGEMHGTVESLDAVQHFICAALEQGHAVRLGLETGHAQSAALDLALAPPFEEERIKRAANSLWSIPDGKGSGSTLKLLKHVSAWKAEGLDVSVFTYDGEAEDYQGATNIANVRDATMAREIDRNLEGFDGISVVLTGNFHARKTAFEFADQTFVPMASLITERPVFVLTMIYGPGEAWVNASVQNEDGSIEENIGPLQLSGNAGDDAPMRTFDLEIAADEPYDGYYYTGPITASPPAFPDLFDQPDGP